MLRVPGSRVFREKILQVLHVLAVFGLCALRDAASTRSVSMFCTANTAMLAVFRGSILLWNTAVHLEYFGVRYSGSCTARTSSTRSISALVLPMLSILGSISGFHTARCSNTRSISGFILRGTLGCVLLGAFYSNAEVFRGTILWILGVLQIFYMFILRVLLVLEDMYCSYSQHSQYLGLQYCSYSKYSEYFRIQYGSYSRVLVVFAPSVLLILQSTRST